MLLALAGLPVLIIAALRCGSTTAEVASTVFGASAILLYLASTLYHAIPHLRSKELLQRFDYAAIYLLIAGIYTIRTT